MNKIEIGDVIIDIHGFKWVVYDFVEYNGLELAAVTDFDTERKNEILHVENFLEIQHKPNNVEWLFIRKREHNLRCISGGLK